MSQLRISDTFSLPLDVVTSTSAILARKRSGKSYTSDVIAEEMMKLGSTKKRIHELEIEVGKGGTADMGLADDIAEMERELIELRPLREQVAILSGDVEKAEATSDLVMSFVHQVAQMAEDVRRRVADARVESGEAKLEPIVLVAPE